MSKLAERMSGKKFDPWIGVDLDGTLAYHKSGNHDPEKIGKPLKPMVDRVRRWLKAGKKVKIFTARADDEKSVTAIRKWLQKHDLPPLEVTNLKDEMMTELWDDKAVGVKKNTGKPKVSEAVVDQLLGVEPKTWREYWVSPKAEVLGAQNGHISWAISHVLRPTEWKKDEHGQFVGVYASMHRRGWLRVSVDRGHVMADLYHATDTQREALQIFADEKGLSLSDDRSRGRM